MIIALLKLRVATDMASEMLRVPWSAWALVAILTRALSSSSLLVMFGVRGHYGVAIIFQNGEVINSVTCMCDMVVTYFSSISEFKSIFYGMPQSEPHQPIYTNQKFTKPGIHGILC